MQPLTLTTILDRGALAGSPGRHARPRYGGYMPKHTAANARVQCNLGRRQCRKPAGAEPVEYAVVAGQDQGCGEIVVDPGRVELAGDGGCIARPGLAGGLHASAGPASCSPPRSVSRSPGVSWWPPQMVRDSIQRFGDIVAPAVQHVLIG